MSNPTSNFNWQMPTNTDLVTDLPADFEVFGQAVDSTMADLKGGTTGQILSKATNADMDFTWIANDQGDITAVNVTSPITGGGTSGAVTVGIQSASTSQSGAVQLTDSTSSTSTTTAATPNALKTAYDLASSAYTPAFTNNFYAGKNKVINGDFTINQRNFTSTTTEFIYGVDRFFMRATGGTNTYSVQQFTPGTAPVAGYESKQYVRLVSSGQSGTGDRTILRTYIENVRTFAGQTVTISFWAKAATGTPNICPSIFQSYGTGGSPSANNDWNLTTKKTITTSWARYSFTGVIPSIAGKTIGTNGNDYIALDIAVSAGSTLTQFDGIGLQSNTFDIWGLQLEAGSTATPFQTASGSIQGELALCQRYYARISAQASSTYYATGFAYSTTVADFQIPLPVQMRTYATALDYSAMNIDDGVTSYSSGTWSISASTYSVNCIPVRYTHGSAALTQFRPYRIGATSSSGYIGVSAEL